MEPWDAWCRLWHWIGRSNAHAMLEECRTTPLTSNDHIFFISTPIFEPFETLYSWLPKLQNHKWCAKQISWETILKLSQSKALCVGIPLEYTPFLGWGIITMDFLWLIGVLPCDLTCPRSHPRMDLTCKNLT